MISFFIFYAIILCKEDKNMKPNIEELRKKIHGSSTGRIHI